MRGQIILSAVHRGTGFSFQQRTYTLLNGQAISRSTFPDLSDVWPSGAYGGGGTTTPMHMPDTAGLYLRGADFNRSADPGSASRTALSGILPTGSNVGSFQSAALKSHAHVSGTQTGVGGSMMDNGSESTNRFASSADQLGTGFTLPTSSRPVRLAASPEFDVDHTLVFMYIVST
jgi:hypothetical protein